MRPMIEVRPKPALRRAFAVWATEQRPKVRTVSPVSFAVPGDLFAGMPEELLLGARVDGHAYVPVPASDSEDEGEGGEQQGEGEGASGARQAAPDGGDGTPGPPDASQSAETPPAAPAPDVVVPAPRQELKEPSRGPNPCPDCPRDFNTPRALSMHRSQVHKGA